MVRCRHRRSNPIRKVTAGLEAWKSLMPDRWASAEAQVAALSDDIAYLSHDIDDGLRAELLSLGDLVSAPLAGTIMADVLRGVKTGDRGARRLRGEPPHDHAHDPRPGRGDEAASREPGAVLAGRHSRRARSHRRVLAAMASDIAGLRAFLMDRVYRSQRVMRVMQDAEAIVEALFTRYLGDAAAMPQAWQLRSAGSRRPPARPHHRRFRGRHDRPLCHSRAPPSV